MELRTRGAAVVMAAMVALLGGCTGSDATPRAPSGSPAPSGSSTTFGSRPAQPGVAAIAVGGPDCLADEVLALLDGADQTGPKSGRRTSTAGSVPRGFDPVRVVQCRGGPLFWTEPANADPGRRKVVEVVLTGDLEPLLAALARASDPVRPDQPCPDMFEIKPQIYLVDARGRAVRPGWPVDGCGFLHKEAWAALDGLTETGSTELVAG